MKQNIVPTNEKVKRQEGLNREDLILLSTIIMGRMNSSSLKIRDFNPEDVRKYRILLFKLNYMLDKFQFNNDW